MIADAGILAAVKAALPEAVAVLLPGPADTVALWQAGEEVARGPELDRYEMFILGEMPALNEARALLLAEIEREGRVHGR